MEKVRVKDGEKEMRFSMRYTKQTLKDNPNYVTPGIFVFHGIVKKFDLEEVLTEVVVGIFTSPKPHPKDSFSRIFAMKKMGRL